MLHVAMVEVVETLAIHLNAVVPLDLRVIDVKMKVTSPFYI